MCWDKVGMDWDKVWGWTGTNWSANEKKTKRARKGQKWKPTELILRSENTADQLKDIIRNVQARSTPNTATTAATIANAPATTAEDTHWKIVLEPLI